MSKECDLEYGAEAFDLDRLISTYLNARAAWLATGIPDADLISDGEHFEAFEAASRAVLYHPCLSADDIQRKISFVLDATDLYMMVKEDEDDNGDVLRVFLSSLIDYLPISQPRH